MRNGETEVRRLLEELNAFDIRLYSFAQGLMLERVTDLLAHTFNESFSQKVDYELSVRNYNYLKDLLEHKVFEDSIENGYYRQQQLLQQDLYATFQRERMIHEQKKKEKRESDLRIQNSAQQEKLAQERLNEYLKLQKKQNRPINPIPGARVYSPIPGSTYGPFTSIVNTHEQQQHQLQQQLYQQPIQQQQQPSSSIEQQIQQQEMQRTHGKIESLIILQALDKLRSKQPTIHESSKLKIQYRHSPIRKLQKNLEQQYTHKEERPHHYNRLLSSSSPASSLSFSMTPSMIPIISNAVDLQAQAKGSQMKGFGTEGFQAPIAYQVRRKTQIAEESQNTVLTDPTEANSNKKDKNDHQNEQNIISSAKTNINKKSGPNPISFKESLRAISADDIGVLNYQRCLKHVLPTGNLL